MLDDWFDPRGQVDNIDLLEEIHRQDALSDAFLVGRQTFEDLLGYWPTLFEDPTGVAGYLDAVAKYDEGAKYVVSNTLIEPQWQHTTVVSGDPVVEVEALK